MPAEHRDDRQSRVGDVGDDVGQRHRMGSQQVRVVDRQQEPTVEVEHRLGGSEKRCSHGDGFIGPLGAQAIVDRSELRESRRSRAASREPLDGGVHGGGDRPAEIGIGRRESGGPLRRARPIGDLAKHRGHSEARTPAHRDRSAAAAQHRLRQQLLDQIELTGPADRCRRSGAGSEIERGIAVVHHIDSTGGIPRLHPTRGTLPDSRRRRPEPAWIRRSPSLKSGGSSADRPQRGQASRETPCSGMRRSEPSSRW